MFKRNLALTSLLPLLFTACAKAPQAGSSDTISPSIPATRSTAGAGNASAETPKADLPSRIADTISSSTNSTPTVAAPTLTLDQALTAMLTSNPEILKAKEKAKEMGYFTSAAKKRIFPTVEADVNYSRSNTLTGTIQKYSIGLVQVIWDGTYRSTVGQNVARQMAQESAADSVSHQLQSQVANLYLALVKTKEGVKTQKLQLEVVSRIFDDVKTAYSLGLANKQSFFDAQAELKKAELAFKSTQGSSLVACLNLLNLMATSNVALCENPLDPGLPGVDVPPSNEEAMKKALENRPEVKIDLALVTAAELGVKLVRADYYPKIVLSGNVGYSNNPTGPIMSPLPGLNDNWNVGIGIKIPIFDGGRKKERLAAARSEVEQAKQDAITVQNKIVTEVLTSLANLETAKASIDTAIAGQMAAENSLNESLTAYRLGSLSLTDLLIRQSEKSAADLRLVEAKASLAQSLYALKVTLGSGLSTLE